MGTCRICCEPCGMDALCKDHGRIADITALVLIGRISDWGPARTPTHREVMVESRHRGYAHPWRVQVPIILKDIVHWLDDGPTESGATAA